MVQEYQWDVLCETYKEETTTSCELRFGSWTLPNNKMTLKKLTNHMDANSYAQNHIYELGKTKAEEHEKEYPFRQGEFYDDVTFSFTLKRRPLGINKVVHDMHSGSSIVRCPLVAVLLSVLVVSFLN